MTNAKVKGIYTITMESLDQNFPDDPQTFCIPVRVMAGPLQSEGAEAFDVKVCSIGWLEQQVAEDGFALGMHSIFVAEYDPDQIRQLLTKFFERYSGNSWQEVARKLEKLGHWEFEE